MDLNGVSTGAKQEWDALCGKRERSQLRAHCVPYDQRKWEYARWDSRLAHGGGRNTAPHHCKCEAPHP